MISYQDRILEKLDIQNSILSAISTDIALLKKTDDALKDGNEKIMEDISKLKEKITTLEKMIFSSWIVIGVMAAKMGFSFLLNLK